MCYFKERTSFCFFLLTFWQLMRPQKNDAIFCVLFLRSKKNVREHTFFYKERKRMQENTRPFIKNARERAFFHKECKRTQENARSFEKNVCQTLITCTIIKYFKRSLQPLRDKKGRHFIQIILMCVYK